MKTSLSCWIDRIRMLEAWTQCKRELCTHPVEILKIFSADLPTWETVSEMVLAVDSALHHRRERNETFDCGDLTMD
jgi:hypothetical protein